MKLLTLAAGAVVLVLLFLAGRKLLQQEDTKPGAAASSSATAGITTAPASNDPLERGKAAYFKHCVACHSPDTDEYIAGLTMKNYFKSPATRLSDGTLFPRTDAAIRELIEKGTGNMPPLSKGMTPEEIADVLAYLHTL